jgi:hypothetical protein
MVAAVAEQIGREGVDIEAALTALTRNLAAALVPDRDKPRTNQPTFLGRRMAVVTVVNTGPPLTADVTVGAVTIPGASPQSTYRPQVGDIVWLEMAGTDPQISPPVTTDANRKWNTSTLAGAWTVVGQTPGYWRDPTGMVYLRGAIGGGALPSTITTLPSGFRPPAFCGFAVPRDGAFGMVSVDNAGVVSYQAGAAAPAALYLDGVHFRVD